jgi:hypothetical protein
MPSKSMAQKEAMGLTNAGKKPAKKAVKKAKTKKSSK